MRAAGQHGFGHLAPFQQRRTAGIELAVNQRQTGLGQRLFEPLQPFAGAVVIGHHRAEEGDVAIARRDNRLGHLAPCAAV